MAQQDTPGVAEYPYGYLDDRTEILESRFSNLESLLDAKLNAFEGKFIQVETAINASDAKFVAKLDELMVFFTARDTDSRSGIMEVYVPGSITPGKLLLQKILFLKLPYMGLLQKFRFLQILYI
jgi:hypothetical protein